MKLLHLIRTLDPAIGGPIEVLRQFGQAATRKGNAVEVVTLDAPEAQFLAGFPLPVHALGPAKGRFGYTDRLVPWLIANGKRYDVVVVEGLWQFHSYGAWKALAGRIPYVVFTHGMLDPWFKKRYPLKHLKKSLFWWTCQYRVLRAASAVVHTCEQEAVLARESFPSLRNCNQVVSPLGVAGPPATIEQDRAAFLEHFPELADRRLLLFLSRIHPKKGCDLLIEAFARVASDHPDSHLVMAGPDEIGWKDELVRSAAARGVADRITWTGMLTGELKWGAFHSAEAFILPSHSENFGMVIAEALACGAPVLISDKVNIWREIERDGAGIVQPDTLQGTVELLQRWFALDGSVSNDMRRRARTCFVQRFEIENAAQSFIELMSSLSQASQRADRDRLVRSVEA
jgi:glycosyltransferase involved in cell wall biosynthesis